MKTLLIDGDMLAYRNAAALEEGSTMDWGDGVVSRVDQSPVGHVRMSGFITSLERSLFADRSIVCLSDDYQFRTDLSPFYKANRNEKKRPALLKPFKEYLKSEHGALVWEGLEADDIMGVLATGGLPTGEETIIVSIDKDMRQIPGQYYNPHPHKREPAVEDISLVDADNWFFFQTLVGDVIDGYKGCQGIGPKKANDLIKQVRTKGGGLAELWSAVLQMFLAKGMTEADALLNARTARILRHEDYDPMKGPKLWTPPTSPS
jgi:DNA polymerase-1